MLRSSDEYLCRSIIHIFCLFSLLSLWLSLSQCLADPQRYIVRNKPNGDCTTKLLENVKDSAFTASSVYRNDPDFGPITARIYSLHDSTDKSKGWCPNNHVHNSSTEWLQIEFNSAKFIKNIFTEGRDYGNYGEFVTNYYFDYQRELGSTWYRYKDINLGEIIPANNDARNSAYKKFDSPVVVNRIRIIPVSNKPQKVCLRIGLYGCDFNDGIVEYQIPRGDSMDNNSFDDFPYDGIKFSNQTWLQGGIGKLVDNNILLNATPIKQLPNYVVAWNRNQQTKDYVQLLFRFQTERKLRFVKIYNTEEPSISFHLFKSLVVELLSNNGNKILESIHVQNPKFQKYHPVLIELKDFVAKFVRIKIFFSSDWIALNEVVFSSVEAEIATNRPMVIIPTDGITDGTTETITSPVKLIYGSQNLVYYIILITCIIGSVILTGVGFFLCFLWMKQRQRRRYKNKYFDHRSMLFNDPYNNTCGLRTISGNNPLLYRPLTPHSYVPSITNNAQNLGFRFVHSQFPPCPDFCPPPINNSNEYEAIDSYWPKSMSQSISFTDPKLDQHDRQTLLSNTAPDITCINKTGAVYCSASSYSSNIYSQPDTEINFPAPDILPLSVLSQDTLNNIVKIHLNNPLKGPLGSTISNFQLAPASSVWIEQSLSRIPEIPANQISFKALISEGEIAAFVGGHIESKDMKVLVARYNQNSLRTDSKSIFYQQCFAILKEDFSSHPNLLSIIGQSMIGGDKNLNIPSIVFAYPSQINIVSFFKRLRHIHRTGEISFTCNYVSQNSLLYLVKQLSGALCHLSEIGVVHKDVSARNCSIGENFHLILNDFAIGVEEFSEDYIPLRTSSFNNDPNAQLVPIKLPLLWMPWEAIIMGNYSTKSDIWSFGVTVWEIFTECQMKPFSSIYNQTQDISINILNIIRNSMLIANNHHSSILPNNRSLDVTQAVHDNHSQKDSSKQIRDIMIECWRSDPATRPNFQKLYLLLCNLIPASRPMTEYGALYQLIV